MPSSCHLASTRVCAQSRWSAQNPRALTQVPSEVSLSIQQRERNYHQPGETRQTAQVRIGGRETARQKKMVVHRMAPGDDKKLPFS